MDMQRSGSLADSAPGPSEQKTFSRSQHAVLATVRQKPLEMTIQIQKTDNRCLPTGNRCLPTGNRRF